MKTKSKVSPERVEALKHLCDLVQMKADLSDDQADNQIGYDPAADRLILSPRVVLALLADQAEAAR